MRIHADYNWDIARNLKITIDGTEVPFCKWFDTELGIAECHYAAQTKDGRNRLLFVPTRSEYITEEQLGKESIPSYYLHNFEVRDNRTDEKQRFNNG